MVRFYKVENSYEIKIIKIKINTQKICSYASHKKGVKHKATKPNKKREFGPSLIHLSLSTFPLK